MYNTHMCQTALQNSTCLFSTLHFALNQENQRQVFFQTTNFTMYCLLYLLVHWQEAKV